MAANAKMGGKAYTLWKHITSNDSLKVLGSDDIEYPSSGQKGSPYRKTSKPDDIFTF